MVPTKYWLKHVIWEWYLLRFLCWCPCFLWLCMYSYSMATSSPTVLSGVSISSVYDTARTHHTRNRWGHFIDSPSDCSHFHSPYRAIVRTLACPAVPINHWTYRSRHLKLSLCTSHAMWSKQLLFIWIWDDIGIVLYCMYCTVYCALVSCQFPSLRLAAESYIQETTS